MSEPRCPECGNLLKLQDGTIDDLVARTLQEAMIAVRAWQEELERLQAIVAKLVPQTYGEAIMLYPWLWCQSHEWDNRTTAENAAWLVGILSTPGSAASAAVPPQKAGRDGPNH